MKLLKNGKYLYIVFDITEEEMDVPILKIDTTTRKSEWFVINDDETYEEIDKAEEIK